MLAIMQAYARPDVSERTLAYSPDTCKWEPRPNPCTGPELRREAEKVCCEVEARRELLTNQRQRALVQSTAVKSTSADEAKDVDIRRLKSQLTRPLSLRRRALIQPLSLQSQRKRPMIQLARLLSRKIRLLIQLIRLPAKAKMMMPEPRLLAKKEDKPVD